MDVGTTQGGRVISLGESVVERKWAGRLLVAVLAVLVGVPILTNERVYSPKPLFKLSPLTEEEARRGAILRVVKWVGVGLVVVGMGWWLWKRRRAGG